MIDMEVRECDVLKQIRKALFAVYDLESGDKFKTQHDSYTVSESYEPLNDIYGLPDDGMLIGMILGQEKIEKAGE